MARYTARVERKFTAPGPQANGLQATADGLWVIDQVDLKASKLNWESGAVVHEITTDTWHSSGITMGDGALWVSSTYGLEIVKVDPETGDTLGRYPDPGRGLPSGAEGQESPRESSSHGLEWRDGHLYAAAPPTQSVHVIEVASWREVDRFPTGGLRVHGLGWYDDRMLWVADTSAGVVALMDTTQGGRIYQVFRVAEPDEVHGLTVRPGVSPAAGAIWFCDAESGDIGILHRDYALRPEGE